MSALLQAMRMGAHAVNNDVKLLIAVKDTDVGAACKLLACGADANAEGANGWRPLHYACDIAHAKLAQTLMFKGADVNAASLGGLTPLHLGVDARSEDVVHLLIRAGATINAVDSGGNTPLHFASKRGDVRIGTILIASGADVQTRKNVTLWAPIHEAAACGSVPMVILLKAAGADIDAPDVLGLTPLHLAAKAGDTAMATTLIRLGANASLQDMNDYTPAMLARRHNHDDLARTIKRDYNLCRRGWVLQLLHLVTTGRARIADGRYELPEHHLVAPASRNAAPQRKSSGEKRLRADVVGTSPPPASPALRRRCAAGLPTDSTTRAAVAASADGVAAGAGAGAGAGYGSASGSGEDAGSGAEEPIPRLPPPPHATHRRPAREDSVLRRLRALRHKRAMSVSSSGSDEPRPSRSARARSGSATAGGHSSRGRELRRRWSATSSAVPMPPSTDAGGEEAAQAAEALVRMAALVPDLQMYIIKML